MIRIKFKKGYIAVYGNSWPMRFNQFLMGGEKQVRAGAWPPFMFFLDESYELPWLVNHELIHCRQVFELCIIGALLLLIFENLYARLFLGYTALEAYKYSAIEQEAYLNHNNPEYLNNRKMFSVLKYIRSKKRFVIDREGLVKIIS